MSLWETVVKKKINKPSNYREKKMACHWYWQTEREIGLNEKTGVGEKRDTVAKVNSALLIRKWEQTASLQVNTGKLKAMDFH